MLSLPALDREFTPLCRHPFQITEVGWTSISSPPAQTRKDNLVQHMLRLLGRSYEAFYV
jgi:hypothetical protein